MVTLKMEQYRSSLAPRTQRRSQKQTFDGAKIDIIIETSKFSGIFFLSLHVLVQKRLHF